MDSRGQETYFVVLGVCRPCRCHLRSSFLIIIKGNQGIQLKAKLIYIHPHTASCLPRRSLFPSRRLSIRSNPGNISNAKGLPVSACSIHSRGGRSDGEDALFTGASFCPETERRAKKWICSDNSCQIAFTSFPVSRNHPLLTPHMAYLSDDSFREASSPSSLLLPPHVLHLLRFLFETTLSFA